MPICLLCTFLCPLLAACSSWCFQSSASYFPVLLILKQWEKLLVSKFSSELTCFGIYIFCFFLALLAHEFVSSSATAATLSLQFSWTAQISVESSASQCKCVYNQLICPSLCRRNLVVAPTEQLSGKGDRRTNVRSSVHRAWHDI
jgi:hypothetical protein